MTLAETIFCFYYLVISQLEYPLFFLFLNCCLKRSNFNTHPEWIIWPTCSIFLLCIIFLKSSAKLKLFMLEKGLNASVIMADYKLALKVELVKKVLSTGIRFNQIDLMFHLKYMWHLFLWMHFFLSFVVYLNLRLVASSCHVPVTDGWFLVGRYLCTVLRLALGNRTM